MITHVHIKNFKCFQEFDIDLDPLTVLVGPNDSGKTAFLQAMRLLAEDFGWERPAGRTIPTEKMQERFGLTFSPGIVWQQQVNCDIHMTARAERPAEYRVQMEMADSQNLTLQANVIIDRNAAHNVMSDRDKKESDMNAWFDWNAEYYSFEPNALRQPVRMSDKLEKTGLGLPAVIEQIRDDIEQFRSFQNEFCRRFPHYKIIKRDPIREGDTDKLALKFLTREGTDLSADSVSDGVMLSLAFLALKYAAAEDEKQILLIEEPENGVHHASLHEIIETLRRMTETGKTQVILTTHSPYLLDEVAPEQVRVFAKMEDGAVKAKKLSDYPDVERMKKHFETGEIWTEFDEKDIVKGKAGA